MKGLRCSVYEDKSIGNCSNNGISARCKSVTLVGDGIPGIFESSESAPAVVLKKKNIGGEYLYAVPTDLVDDEREARLPVMFGGSFIYASDGRFPSRQPIPLHDRVESWDGYNFLSAD